MPGVCVSSKSTRALLPFGAPAAADQVYRSLPWRFSAPYRRRRAHICVRVWHVAQLETARVRVYVPPSAYVRARAHLRSCCGLLSDCGAQERLIHTSARLARVSTRRSPAPPEVERGELITLLNPRAASSRFPPRFDFSSAARRLFQSPLIRLNSLANSVFFLFLGEMPAASGEKDDREEISWNECAERARANDCSRMHISTFLFCSRKRRRC